MAKKLKSGSDKKESDGFIYKLLKKDSIKPNSFNKTKKSKRAPRKKES